MKISVVLLCASAILVFANPALPHHSNTAYQPDQVISVTGTVKEWKWVNPHTWLYFLADDGKGGKTEWGAEGRPPGVLGRIGWDRNVFKIGEKVTVYMNPAKDGSHFGIIARVVKEDGTVLTGNLPSER